MTTPGRTECTQPSVHSSDQPLPSSLLIPGRSVDLASQEQSADLLGLQGGCQSEKGRRRKNQSVSSGSRIQGRSGAGRTLELLRVDVVVLHSIPSLRHDDFL